jgi:hypothetical protein
MRAFVLMLAVVTTASPGVAAPPTPPANPPPGYGCPNPEYRQFDFWVGKWNVTRTQDGQAAGSSEITLLDKGCVILESWTGAQGGSGHSLNVFDQADGRWHQTWVGTTGDQVHYIGEFKNRAMRFNADDVSTPQKAPAIKTMTFEPRPDGTVRQSGTISTDGGKTFQPSFDLVYTRVK